ncbi:MAG TPA: OmpA family protein [Polyangiaceae bacterium]|nr:OmpA family protein [Polyangiaceae bacterium]
MSLISVRRHARSRSWACVVAAATQVACVPKARYDQCVSDSTELRARADAQQRQDAAQLQYLSQQLAQAQAGVQDRDGRLNDLSTQDHNLQAHLDEATAINQQLRVELQRLGTDVDKMLAERGTLANALQDAKVRLEELRKAQAVGEARVQLFRDLEKRFSPLVDSGQLRIESRRGELVMNVQGDLLFEEGRSDIREAGKGVLMEIARAIEVTSPPSSGRRFLVTANTDEDEKEPLRSGASRRSSATSWELTASRSVAVVQFLVSVGVSPASLTAAAAGSFDPVVANDDPRNRAKNRRVEIALLPSASIDASRPSPQAARDAR